MPIMVCEQSIIFTKTIGWNTNQHNQHHPHAKVTFRTTFIPASSKSDFLHRKSRLKGQSLIHHGYGHWSGTAGIIYLYGNIYPMVGVGNPVNQLFNGQAVSDLNFLNAVIAKPVNSVHMLFDVVHIP